MGFLYHNSPFISTGDFPRGRHKTGIFGWIEGGKSLSVCTEELFP